jgi:hypothetical protein
LALSGFEYGRSINFSDLSSNEQKEFLHCINYKGHIDSFGDMTIYNTDFISPNKGKTDLQNIETLSEIYQLLSRGKGAFGIFNHPKGYPNGKGNNFNNFEIFPPAIEAMVGLEVYNGGSAYFKHCDFRQEFILALQNGWRVGAMYNPDSAWPNWGDEIKENCPMGFTMVLGFDRNKELILSKDSLFSQLRKRKFYGSFSPKLLLEMQTTNGATMGDTISVFSPVTLSVRATGSAVSEIKLIGGTVGNKNQKIETIIYQPGTIINFIINPPANSRTDFYFIELIQDGKFVAHSSPIWVRLLKNN